MAGVRGGVAGVAGVKGWCGWCGWGQGAVWLVWLVPHSSLDSCHISDILFQKLVQFWFATGGAGFCINRQLALKMVPWAR